MQIELNHHCHMKGVRGAPGQVIEVTKENHEAAKEIVDRKGATWVGAPEPEVATKAPPENAAARTKAPAGR